MPRINVRNLTSEQLAKLDAQVLKVGLKSRGEYIRLIIELDSATGLIQRLNAKLKYLYEMLKNIMI